MEERTWKSRMKSLRSNLIVTVVFLTLTSLLLSLAISLDIQREKSEFSQTGLVLQGRLEAQIGKDVVALKGFAGFLKSCDLTDREALTSFSRFLLAQESEIHTLLVVQRIPGAEAEAFASLQRQLGNANFRVKNFRGDNAAVWSPVDGTADQYFPITYMEPILPGNAELLGADLGNVKVAHNALLAASTSGATVFSKAFRLLDKDLGYMMIHPVGDSDKPLFAILVSKAKHVSAIVELARASGMSLDIAFYGGTPASAPIWLSRNHLSPSPSLLAPLFPKLQASYPLGETGQPLLLNIERQLDERILRWPILLSITGGGFASIPIMLLYFRARHREELERLQASNTLFMQANFDALTGLPNRQLFMNRLEQALAVAHRQGLILAVLYLDLDGFKGINDYYGHSIGDKVLIRAAKLFSRCIREIDTVARLGGDEFVILLQDIDGHAGAEFVASKIRKAFASSAPVITDVGKIPPALGTSIGIAVYPEDATTIERLIQLADTNMYKDKASRKLAARQGI